MCRMRLRFMRTQDLKSTPQSSYYWNNSHRNVNKKLLSEQQWNKKKEK